MGAVIVAGRYVPRPPEDNIWNTPGNRGISENYLPVGGGFPFKNKRWAFNLDDATVWYRNGSSFSALRIPPPPVLPFSNNYWQIKGHDAPVWAFWKYQQSGSPLLYISAAAAAPFTPSSWSFKGTDYPSWNFWKYQQSGGTLQMPVGGGFPFVPTTWSFKSDDNSFWNFWKYQQSGVNSAIQLVGGGFPFVNKRWAFDHQVEPTWQNASVPVPPVLGLVGGNYPFKPTFWKQNADDAGVWSNKSFGPSLVLELASNLPVSKPPYWEYNNDDGPVWSGGPRNVGRVIDFALVTPLTPKRWAFDYDQQREWVGQPFPAFNLLTQTLQLFAPATLRPFAVGDEPSTWAGNRAQVNNLLLAGQVVVAPFAPSRWKFDNDDGSVWNAKSSPIPASYLPVGGGFPFVPVRWRNNNDDASLWTVKSAPIAPVQALVNGNNPIRPAFWGYNNDDAGTWRGFPANVSIVQQLVIATPLTPTRWTRDYDQSAFWSGAPTNVPITITQPLPPVEPVVNRSNSDGGKTKGGWRKLYRQRVLNWEFLEEQRRLEEEASEAKAKAIKAKAKLKKIKKAAARAEHPIGGAAEVRLEAALFAVEQAKFKAQDAAAALEAHLRAEVDADDEEVMEILAILAMHDVL